MVCAKANQLFYVGLKAFLEHQGKILVLKENPRLGHGEEWELPGGRIQIDRKSTRLNSSHIQKSRMPSSA